MSRSHPGMYRDPQPPPDPWGDFVSLRHRHSRMIRIVVVVVVVAVALLSALRI